MRFSEKITRTTSAIILLSILLLLGFGHHDIPNVVASETQQKITRTTSAIILLSILLLLGFGHHDIPNVVASETQQKGWDYSFCSNQTFSSSDPASGMFGLVLDSLVNRMAKVPWWSGATEKIKTPRIHPLVYALANCTETSFFYTGESCYECLRKAKRVILKRCPHKVGGQYMRDVCYLRYEVYDFMMQ